MHRSSRVRPVASFLRRSCHARRRAASASSRSCTCRTSRRSPALLAGALAASDLGCECFEPRSPEAPESIQPGVHLGQGARVERVQAARALGEHRREAAVAQHLELLRDRGLGDAELGGDDLDDLCRSRPYSDRSQPTPTAPGPNVLKCSAAAPTVSLCAMCSSVSRALRPSRSTRTWTQLVWPMNSQVRSSAPGGSQRVIEPLALPSIR